MEIRIQSLDGFARTCEVGLRLSGRCVNRGLDRWFWGVPKVGLTVTDLHDQSGMNPVVSDLDGKGRLFHERVGAGQASRAWCAQALHPAPERWERNGDAAWILDLPEDGSAVLHFCLVMGESSSVGEEAVDLVKRVPELLEETEENWRRLWKETFAGGGSVFSGQLEDLSLPEEIVSVGASAALSAIMLRRQHRPNAGKVRYSISTPRRVEACFYPNDWSMAGHLLARLDPQPTWEQLEIALTADIRKFNQINTLTNKGGDFKQAGWPYTVDIYNCFFVCLQLVEAGGDEVLERTISTVAGERTLLEVMEDLASDYRARLNSEYGLADYGPRQELLECVSTYEHVVAGLNAAAAWMLDQLATIYERIGRGGEVEPLRAESERLVEKILEHLYVEGMGWFRVITADGEARECRHVWDIAMVLMCIGDRLPGDVQGEIVKFLGAFGSWPAEMLLGLLKIGRRDVAEDWLRGIARTARQGPFGQAYYDEGVWPSVFDGAAKVTEELPQCCHWCNISGAMFYEVLVKMAGGACVEENGAVCESSVSG
jgi:hypothetical protein